MSHIFVRRIGVACAAAALLLCGAPFARAFAPDFAPCCLSAIGVNTHEIDLSWVPIGSPDPAISGFMIERESPIGGGFATIVANTGSTATTYQDSNLAPGVTYNYRVSAVNADGVGSPSMTDAATTVTTAVVSVPQAPPQPTATITGANSVRIDWTAPASTGAITGYRIERSAAGGNDFITLVENSGSTATTYSDDNLAPGATYGYRITAFDSAGPGPTSPVLAVMMQIQPSAPQNVNIVAGDGLAAISWAVPGFTGGGITGYRITQTDTGSTTDVGNVLAATIAGLTNGANYSFTVAAMNFAGVGPASPAVRVVPRRILQIPTSTPPTPVPAPLVSTTLSNTPAAGTATYLFTYLLQLGARGAAVTALQKRLTAEGIYSGPITGYFGVLTRASVKAYQARNGISATGVVGVLTRARLNTAR